MTPSSSAALATRAGLRRAIPWLAGACAATAVVYGVIAVVAAVLDASTSVWASSGWMLQWVAFAFGVAVGNYLRVFVAHGLTRRTSMAASVWIAGVLAAGMALFVQLGLGVEWLLHRAASRPYEVDSSHLFRGVGEVHLVLAEYGLMFAAFLVTGWLIMVSYFRFGGRVGTLTLPVTALPAIGTLTALIAGSVGPPVEGAWPWVASIGRPLAVALAMASVAAGLLAVRALTRTIPVR